MFHLNNMEIIIVTKLYIDMQFFFQKNIEMSSDYPPGFVIFQAEYDYTPSHDGEIGLQVGDQCYVQKPIADLQGWLDGFNSRSKENGQFPGTYCIVVNFDATLPPLPPKPNPKGEIMRESKNVVNCSNL